MITKIALLVLPFAVACAQPRPFPHADVMARDPDMVPFSPKPAKYESPQVWNTIDNTVFEPLVGALALRRTPRAINVNALDEVPDSSWFTNRLDALVDDPHAFARGPCIDEPPLAAAGPWTVIGGKPNGANPGFMVRHASGKKYLFKLDGVSGERPSAADVIGSRIYYAAGYNAPCNEIVYLDPATLTLSPDAMAEDFVGDKVHFTREMLDTALAKGLRNKDGRIRGGLSLLLPRPLGPWKDFGTRADDPNDVIRHEDRRDLRASYVFGAWLAHYDAREQNSLDTWVETSPGAGFIKHFMLDFGDCLGSMSNWRRVSGRRGHAYELDVPLALAELVTLGAIDRPWRHAQPVSRTFGNFTAENLEPDNYRTAYPYGPYTRMTEADAAWGARLLARMTPDLIHAVIAEAHLSDPADSAELERTLLGRRDKLLRRYLGRLSPLARPRLDERGRLCLIDVRVEAGVTPGPADVCVAIPQRDGDQVLEVRANGTAPVRVHVYRVGGAFRIIGLERQSIVHIPATMR
jgi:hypothetical protein